MSRIDGLQENKLIAELLSLARDVDELKNRQRTSGRSGVLSYTSNTANTWDLTGSVTGATVQTLEFTMTYIGNGSQQYPVINPYLDLFINGTDEAHRLPLDETLLDTGGGNIAIYAQNLLIDTSTLSDPLVTRWITQIRVSGNITYYIKAYGVGTSHGTVGVVRTL